MRQTTRCFAADEPQGLSAVRAAEFRSGIKNVVGLALQLLVFFPEPVPFHFLAAVGGLTSQNRDESG